MDLLNQISEAAAFIRSKSQTSPKIGLILGSGLGSLADKIESPDKIPYDQIPHFPVSTVEGHAGQSDNDNWKASRSLRCRAVSTITKVIPWNR